jgi:acyl-CoA synthetase (AMP-forming)/AMP-acid ligase II/thioesterase domain-containing protein
VPARPALLAPGRPELSHAELHALITRTAAGLQASGIGRSSRVALVIENGPEAATAFLAIASAAAVAPLNPAYSASELAFYLEDLRAEAVVVSTTVSSPVRDVAAECGLKIIELVVDPSTPAGTFKLSGLEPGDSPPLPPDESDIALLLHTSGTTSRPKLVPLTHGQLSTSARNVAATLELGPEDRCLNVMPLFHIHGLVAALLASLDAGASVVCTPGFHQVRFFEWLAALDPTWYSAVPTMHAAVLARIRDRGQRVPRNRVRFIRSSSAALPVPVLEGLEEVFRVPVVEAYGMTEAAHQMASNPLPPGVRKPGSVGLPAGPEIAILDRSGRSLAAGQIGEVAIRGTNVFAGYEANPEANADAFADGWFRTGDEGSLDEDGYLTLRGRIKEIINRGGEKVSPVEIDDALLRHPAVEQAVTFGVPDDRLGEEVAAAVVLDSAAEADERDLQDFVAQQLAPFKVPRSILVVDEIPKGPTGKVQRIGLAERLGVERKEAAGLERAPYGFLEFELIGIWESVLGVSGLGVGDDFFALGGDSILAAEVVARIRDLTGARDLPLTSIVRAPTPAAMSREVFSDLGVAGRSGIVPLQEAGDRTPIFFVHPGDGDVFAYAPLAPKLGGDQPSYAIRARGIDDGRSIQESVEEMASDYVDEIRQVQPRGPYILGGFCVGGAIAFEMARQLDAAREQVATILLLDPRFPRPRSLRYDAWLVPRRLRDRQLAGALARRGARRLGLPVAPPAEPDDAHFFSPKLARVRESYRPRPLDLPATVIVSASYANYFELPRWYLRSLVRRPTRWTTIDAQHPKLLLQPAIETVAREIVAAVDMVSAS